MLGVVMFAGFDDFSEEWLDSVVDFAKIFVTVAEFHWIPFYGNKFIPIE